MFQTSALFANTCEQPRAAAATYDAQHYVAPVPVAAAGPPARRGTAVSVHAWDPARYETPVVVVPAPADAHYAAPSYYAGIEAAADRSHTAACARPPVEYAPPPTTGDAGEPYALLGDVFLPSDSTYELTLSPDADA